MNVIEEIYETSLRGDFLMLLNTCLKLTSNIPTGYDRNYKVFIRLSI